MATYATEFDVASLAPQLPVFTVQTKPTDAQVRAHCEDVSREVDAILAGLGYQVPITTGESPIAYARVKTMVAWAGLAFALASRAMGVTNPSDHGADWARKEYERRLKALESASSADELRDALHTSAATEKDAVDLVGAPGLTEGTDDATPVVGRHQVF